MNVEQLINILSDYNPKAPIAVVVEGQSYSFSLSYGSSEGVEKATAEDVSLWVEGLNSNESGIKNNG